MLKLLEEKFFLLNRFEFFMITIVSFAFLYFGFSIAAYFLFTKKDFFKRYQTKAFRPNQIQTEIKRSLISVLMFGVLSFAMYEGLQRGFYKIIFEFDVVTFLVESFILFLWNEIYFYAVHRAFHIKSLYKYHADHHYSHVPSPFSAYSFHWSEGVLLGAVMPVIMCFHDFQVMSLMSLPVMSILMNVLGHSNVDFFPDKDMGHILSFSKRHSLHHKIPHANFGFFLPYFDQIFKTDGADVSPKSGSNHGS